MVKTNAAGVSTLHLAEGQAVLDVVHGDVVLVGPGSGEPVDVEEKAARAKAEVATAKAEAAKPKTAKKAG